MFLQKRISLFLSLAGWQVGCNPTAVKPPDFEDDRPDSIVSFCSSPGSGKSTEKSKRPGQTYRLSS